MDRHRPRRRLRPDGRRRRAGATVHEPEPLVAAAFAALRSRGAGADSRPGVKVGVVDTLCGVVTLVWRRRSTITHDGILAIPLVWFAYLTAMALIGQLWRRDAGMPAFVCLWPLSDRTGAAEARDWRVTPPPPRQRHRLWAQSHGNCHYGQTALLPGILSAAWRFSTTRSAAILEST